MKELPKTIRIGHTTFEVIPEDAPFAGGNSILCGQINYDKQVIRVYQQVGPDRLFETLMHEIMHGIAEFTNVDLSEADIDRFAHAVCMVHRDNPDLFK